MHDILVVDDERDICDLISGILEDEGYEPRIARTGVDALKQIRLRQPSLVILDVWLGDSERDGIKILEIIKRDHPYVPVIMISGHATIETAVSAIKNGAYDFIEKPFNLERLLICVQRAIEAAQLKRENDSLKSKAPQNIVMMGESNLVKKLRRDINKFVESDSRILLSGAVGVGKETMARHLHENGKRKNHPFIKFSVGKMSPVKLEAELFGLELQNQDQQTPRKIGLLEQAHGGVLMLDEIGLVSLPLQAKLCKFLATNQFKRVGASDDIAVNVQIIATSTLDLAAEVKNGNFREDLYYRFSNNQISLPSLSERLDDLELLVSEILGKYEENHSSTGRALSHDVFLALKTHHWPGNISELNLVMESIMMNTDQKNHGPIMLNELPSGILNIGTHADMAKEQIDKISMPLKEARESFERDYIQAQMKRFSGNVSKTASFIGMERSALHRKMKSLGIDETRDNMS